MKLLISDWIWQTPPFGGYYSPSSRHTALPERTRASFFHEQGYERATKRRRTKKSPTPRGRLLPEVMSTPPKLTDRLLRRILDALYKGAGLVLAAKSVGLDSAVFAEWLRADVEPFETLRVFTHGRLSPTPS